MCGEACLPEHCKECGLSLDVQVDMLEFKDYSEIDLNETLVIALTYGHFFTAETLDGTCGFLQSAQCLICVLYSEELSSQYLEIHEDTHARANSHKMY